MPLVGARYFEEYWEKIRDFTFPSTFVPLSCEAAAALLAAHAQWKSHPDQPKVRRPTTETHRTGR
jgi:hypothetical protein